MHARAVQAVEVGRAGLGRPLPGQAGEARRCGVEAAGVNNVVGAAGGIGGAVWATRVAATVEERLKRGPSGVEADLDHRGEDRGPRDQADAAQGHERLALVAPELVACGLHLALREGIALVALDADPLPFEARQKERRPVLGLQHGAHLILHEPGVGHAVRRLQRRERSIQGLAHGGVVPVLLGLLRPDDLDDPGGEGRERRPDLTHDRDRGAHRGEANAECDGGQGLAGLALARSVEDLGHIDFGQRCADRRGVDDGLESAQELGGVVVELRDLGAEVCGEIEQD
jgi:hypothetical protein